MYDVCDEETGPHSDHLPRAGGCGRGDTEI